MHATSTSVQDMAMMYLYVCIEPPCMLTSQGPPVNTLSAFVDIEIEVADSQGLHELFKPVQCLVLYERASVEVNCSNTIHMYIDLYIFCVFV